jgi:hypothetical protein
MRRCHVSRWCGNLRLITSAPLPASNFHSCGSVSLRLASPPQPPLGDLRHLRLPAKHGEHSFCVSEGVTNLKIRLAGVVSDILHVER